MFFSTEELANKHAFKQAVVDLLISHYTDDELPGDALLIKIKRMSLPLRTEIINALSMLDDSSFPISENNMPTMWLESSDIFDMADDDDFSGIEWVLKQLLDWIETKI